MGRLHLLAAVLVGLIALIATSTILFRQQAQAAETRLLEVVTPAEISASGLTTAYSSQADGVRGFLLTRDPSYYDHYSAGRAQAARLESIVSRQLGDDPAVARLLADVRAAADTWQQQSVRPALAKATNRQPVSLGDSQAERQRFEALRTRLAELGNRINEIAAAETSRIAGARATADRFAVGTAVLGVLVAAGTALFLRKSLTHPLRTLVSQVDQVAAGDLDRPVGEVGPLELAALGRAVEQMRTRILDETREMARMQQDLARHEEAERRRAEQDFATVVAALDEGVVVLGSSGVFESANPAAERILGVPRGELVGSAPTAWPLFDDDGRRVPPEEHPGMTTRRTGEPENSRVTRVARADGRDVWLATTSRALNPGNGPPHTVVSSFTDITESRAARERLEREATRDPLTGLANRTLVLRELDGSEQPHRGHPVSLLFIDLDNFKRVNDSLGHGIGDDVLRAVGRRLTRAAPELSVVGRLGGDEFVVLVHGESSDDALAELGKNLIEAIAEPIHLQDRQLHVTGSTGVVVARPGDTRTGQDLLRDADVAMYQAKALGGRCHAFFDVALRESVQRHMVLEQDLRHAVGLDQLRVAYQPVVDLRTERTVAVEALLRWTHPVHGTVSPAEFIPLAEESGLINPIGTHMLHTATHELAAERSRCGCRPQLNANLSPRQLDDPHLSSTVEQALAECGLPARDLCLEITENALMHDPAAAARVLTDLRGLGISLAIDDFGTGHSSLAQLRQLPLDVLKIDRSFISELTTHRELEVIVTSIITMAHGLDLRVVAEGVETAEQFDLLRQLGCDRVQGYYLGKPAPVGDLCGLGRRGAEGS